MDQQLALWVKFCEKYIYDTAGVPLFSTNEKLVNVKNYGRDNRLILKRSELMENLIIQEVTKVIDDFNQSGNIYEGLIYIMYFRKDEIIVPLYIGKSEKFGQRGTNLSANITNIHRDKSRFCRWGDNYAYHIGDLSAVVCPDHPENKKVQKYKRWANRLFEVYPTTEPTLKENVYFWVSAWKKGSIGIFCEFGCTPLTALEYQLISVAATLFPDYLLNFEGVNRGRRITWIIWITLLRFYSMSLSEHLLGIG